MSPDTLEFSFDMTLSIPIIGLPILATVLIWVVVTVWPIRTSGGAFDFGGAVDALVHFVVGLIVTLSLWVIYFATRFYVG